MTTRMRIRLLVGLRTCALAVVTLIAVGLLGRGLDWPVLAGALGPTLYVFLVHPESAQARLCNAVLGHACAVGMGVAMLAAFGLTKQSPQLTSGQMPTTRLFAISLSVGLTMMLLEILDTHHAPAAATALLIASGISRPGTPLIGLVVGLVGVIVLAPTAAKLPVLRRAADHPS